VTQIVDPELKHQYHKKKKNKEIHTFFMFRLSLSLRKYFLFQL
jgi:hypothetical protein